MAPLARRWLGQSGVDGFQPIIHEEMHRWTTEYLGTSKDWQTCVVGDQAEHIMGRVRGRIFLGEELCYQKDITDSSYNSVYWFDRADLLISHMAPPGMKAIAAWFFRVPIWHHLSRYKMLWTHYFRGLISDTGNNKESHMTARLAQRVKDLRHQSRVDDDPGNMIYSFFVMVSLLSPAKVYVPNHHCPRQLLTCRAWLSCL